VTELESARAELAKLWKWVAGVRMVASAQAEDDGLWFINVSAPEAYLQMGLRELHQVIEGERTAESVVAAIKERLS
jgi:hypothetical protein